MGTENALQAPHQLQLDSRSRLHMTGVIEVESFDEATIVLTTTRGTLIVRASAFRRRRGAGRRNGRFSQL